MFSNMAANEDKFNNKRLSKWQDKGQSSAQSDPCLLKSSHSSIKGEWSNYEIETPFSNAALVINCLSSLPDQAF